MWCGRVGWGGVRGRAGRTGRGPLGGGRESYSTAALQLVTKSVCQMCDVSECWCTYLGSTGGVLSGTSSDVGNLVVVLEVTVAGSTSWIASQHSTLLGHPDRVDVCAYMSFWFPSARIASLGLRPYFSRRASPLVTCMSRRGLPMATKMGAILIMSE